MFLKQRSSHGLSRMSSQNQINSLVLESIKDLFRRLTKITNKPLESLLDIRLGSGRALISEIPLLQLLDPSPVSNLHLLSQVG